jgi:hypothetical protein
MKRKLLFTDEAAGQLEALKNNPHKASLYKQVCKTLGLLEVNLRHPSLNTHEYSSPAGLSGEKVWEAYAQNKTPGAYRVFFHYGPDIIKRGSRTAVITIVAITSHP